MIEGIGQRRYSKPFCFLTNVFDPRVPCKYGCSWGGPFGYLRNSSCPKHDWVTCHSSVALPFIAVTLFAFTTQAQDYLSDPWQTPGMV